MTRLAVIEELAEIGLTAIEAGHPLPLPSRQKR
jgi:hypothetical protein